MTVKELRNALNGLPPDLTVVAKVNDRAFNGAPSTVWSVQTARMVKHPHYRVWADNKDGWSTSKPEDFKEVVVLL